MENKKNQLEILESFARHEESVAYLYKEYSILFNDDFWVSLYQDELKHAASIRSFKEKLSDNTFYFNENRFRIEAINSSIKYVEEETMLAKSKEMPEIRAYSAALWIENALLESEIYKIFESDNIELKNLLKTLTDETVIHREKIKNIIEKRKTEKEIYDFL